MVLLKENHGNDAMLETEVFGQDMCSEEGRYNDN